MILSLSPLPFVGRRSNETIPLNQILNFRASERRAELVRAMPSAAENLKANFRASERRAELIRAMPSYSPLKGTRTCPLPFVDRP